MLYVAIGGGIGDYMKKFFNTILVFMLIASVVCTAGCGSGSGKAKEAVTYQGSYHTEADGVKRGADLTIAIKDNAITAMELSSTSDYSITDPNKMQMAWGVKVNALILNLSGMSIDDLNKIEVTLDDKGIPTEIKGMTADWIPDDCTDCTGMLILALQDALKK
jgi:hypothetical protein